MPVLPEELLELFGDDFEAEARRSDAFYRDDALLIEFLIGEQTRCNPPDLLDRPRVAARVGKREAIDRAISADAGNTTKQRIARNLPRNKTGIELEDDLMPGDFSKVIRVRKLSIVHA